jgi:hypothetical protein
MTNKSPRYPVAAADDGQKASSEIYREAEAPPPGLYDAPSFKHRHELREPLEGGDAAYRRAYPHFFRETSLRRARRNAIRSRNF